MLLHLLDHLERHDKFIEFMKNNEFLDMDSYRTMVASIEKFQKGELKVQEKNNSSSISLKEVCSHFAAGITDQNISPMTPGYEECEKEGTPWVGLRLCLTCGHVGCWYASNGMHATKHL